MNRSSADQNRRVLIIDDNRSIHDDFRKILAPATARVAALDVTETELFGSNQTPEESAIFEVDSAYQGQEGMSLVKAALADGRPYALAFVDVRMPPGWDGVETTQRIWAIDPDIQIVLCTAYSDYSWDEVTQKLGQRDGLVILKKPFETVEALQLAHALTEKWCLHRQATLKLEELERIVSLRTDELRQSNGALLAEVDERKRAAEELQWKTAFLEAQVGSAIDGILVVDPAGKKILQNQQTNDLLNIPQKIAEDDDDEKQLRWVTSTTRNPAQFFERVEYLNTHRDEVSRDEIELKDGRLLDRYSSPVFGKTGKYYGRIWTFRDITERRKAEEALRESEKRFSSAFEHAPIGMALVSPDGHWLKVNQSLCDLVGYSEADLLARTFQEITCPEDLDLDLANVRRLIAGEIRSYQMEKRYIHQRGHLVTVLLNVSLVRDDGLRPRYFVAQIQDITERKRAEDALRLSDEKFHLLSDNITDVFWIRSPDLKEVHYISPAFERIWGRSVASLYANPLQWADFVLPEDRERVRAGFAALTAEAPNLDIEYRISRPDGEVRWVRVRGFQVRDSGGKLFRHIGIVTDTTDRKRAEMELQESERRLFQSQKLETVGKLAGGVAHEFNSIMTTIIGQSELLLNELLPGNPLYGNATEIREAAGRAAALTRQLLAYARKQILRPEVLDLNSVLAGMEAALRHLISPGAELRIVPAAGLNSVKADAGQIEQVIMNLAMNAADAMPNGGKLTLETGNVTMGQEYASHYPDLKAGKYVMIAITDTGIGLSEEAKARLFEPFFTTKGVGRGTGLGLSTCYGIIKQSGGHINVYSEPGRGTVFKVYLPEIEPQARVAVQRRDSHDLPRGTESILLVEDDAVLREMAGTLLRQLGYRVYSAANGIEALGLKQMCEIGQVDLLFTDVIMPNMSGRELAELVLARDPHTKVLFASAYTENAIAHQGLLKKGVALLQKPFTPSALAHKLREVLDQPRASAPTTDEFAEITGKAVTATADPAPPVLGEIKKKNPL